MEKNMRVKFIDLGKTCEKTNREGLSNGVSV